MVGINEPIIKRYEKNPILTKHDVPYPVETVHNAGVVKYNSKYIMLFRSHCRNGRSIIGLAESDDGLKFKVRPEPFITPANIEPFASYEEYGVEDPRICVMDGEYLITYSAYSKHGVRVVLAKTNDFTSIKRVSLITQADYRNVVLFPEKINNRYVQTGPPSLRDISLVYLDILLSGPDPLGRFQNCNQTPWFTTGMK